MNFNDFKNLDLKSIDYEALLEKLAAKKQVLVQVGILILSSVFLIVLVNAYCVQSDQYQQSIKKLNAKIGAVESYESSIKKLRGFLSHLPDALDEDALSAQIADLAVANNVAVTGFSPGGKKSDLVSEAISIGLEVRADTYKDFLFFLKALENAPFALRIDSAKLTGPQGAGTETQVIKAHLEVSTVKLNK